MPTFQNDIFYPRWKLHELEKAGISISDLNFVPTYARGHHKYSTEWNAGEDGKVTIPWAVHKNFTKFDESYIAHYLDQLIKDLGCFNFLHISRSELSTTEYQNGILFLQLGGCFSALGKSPVFFNLPEFGAPSTWQGISLDPSTCGGPRSERAVQHEVLHALGVLHEQQRPDRDNYINFYPENTHVPEAYTKMTADSWMKMSPEYGGDFQLDSVMMYGSYDNSIDRKTVMRTKDGATFEGGSRITTMDAMQIQARYCLPLGHEMKENANCTLPDAAGVTRRIFGDRICDGRPDCPGGEDENGLVAPCIDAHPKTNKGCCGHLNLGDRSCRVAGTFDKRDFYICNNDPNHVVFALGSKDWFASTKGLPKNWYSWYARHIRTDGSDNSCPYIGTWKDASRNIPVYCKSKGFDNTNDCEKNKCSKRAECIDGINSYTCVCNENYAGDGFTCIKSKPVDECNLGTHNCHIDATCIDTVKGFTCKCKAGQKDLDNKNPDTNCITDFPCCKEILGEIGGNKLHCTHRRRF